VRRSPSRYTDRGFIEMSRICDIAERGLITVRLLIWVKTTPEKFFHSGHKKEQEMVEKNYVFKIKAKNGSVINGILKSGNRQSDA